MGAILPKPPSGELSREAFFHQILIKPFQGIWGVGTIQVGKLQPGGDCMWQQETLMLLQTLSTRDPDELAEESASQQIGLTLLDESGVIRKCRGVNPQ